MITLEFKRRNDQGEEILNVVVVAAASKETVRTRTKQLKLQETVDRLDPLASLVCLEVIDDRGRIRTKHTENTNKNGTIH